MDARQESHADHLEIRDLDSIGWHGVHTDEENAVGIEEEIFLECIVCQYWSERIEEALRQRKNALTNASRLQGLLKEHQKCGACARRLPAILTDLKPAQHAFALAH